MTVTMSEKHQITIPKKIADVLRLRKGSLFDVQVRGSKIELIPLEAKEKEFTEEDYNRMDRLFEKERGKEVPLTKAMMARLKRGKPL